VIRVSKSGVGKDGVLFPVVITHGEGVKNVRVGKVEVEGVGDKTLKVGTVVVNVEKIEEKNKLKNCVYKKKREEGGAVEGEEEEEVVRGVEVREEGKKKVMESKLKKVARSDGGKANFNESVLLYSSKEEDRLWANRGMVTKVVSGDSSLSLQQRVDDAWFDNVVVTPMGSDRVFLHCVGEEDIWHVFNEAIHFFGLLFSKIHRWSAVDVKYERGAWIRVYGTPVYAWNESFFKTCVMKCGRYIRSDDSTVDKARLDYARVLISTTIVEVVNASTEIVVDGCNFEIKLVEEWGCNLGENAFLTVEDPEPCLEGLNNFDDVHRMEGLQGEMDDLVEDLNIEWSQGSKNKGGSFKDEGCDPLCAYQVALAESKAVPVGTVQQGKQPAACDIKEEAVVKVIGKAKSYSKSNSKSKKIMKAGVNLKYSVGFLKRIARLPVKDRNEILKVLKRQKRMTCRASKVAKVMSNSISTSSNNSNSSVNKDWENWVVLHGKKVSVLEDVVEIGQSLGVTFKGVDNSSFNLLSKEGRREWRAEKVGLVEMGNVEDGGVGREGS